MERKADAEAFFRALTLPIKAADPLFLHAISTAGFDEQRTAWRNQTTATWATRRHIYEQFICKGAARKPYV